MDGGYGRTEALEPEARGVVEPMPHRPEGKFVPRPAGAEEEDERFWVENKPGGGRPGLSGWLELLFWGFALVVLYCYFAGSVGDL
jgi:hypothetical protein